MILLCQQDGSSPSLVPAAPQMHCLQQIHWNGDEAIWQGSRLTGRLACTAEAAGSTLSQLIHLWLKFSSFQGPGVCPKGDQDQRIGSQLHPHVHRTGHTGPAACAQAPRAPTSVSRTGAVCINQPSLYAEQPECYSRHRSDQAPRQKNLICKPTSHTKSAWTFPTLCGSPVYFTYITECITSNRQFCAPGL